MEKENKPLIVTKFEKKRLLPYLFVIFLAILLFGLGALFYRQRPGESYLEYLLTRVASVFFFLSGVYVFVELLNTKEFRVYGDRIEKVARVFKSFPLIGNKVVYYDNAYYGHTGVGIKLCNCRFPVAFRGVLFFIKLLPREDQEKVADILHKVSGREKELFLSWGIVSYVYRFKDKRNE